MFWLRNKKNNIPVCTIVWRPMLLNKMLVIRAGIHKMLVRVASREDPDQTASSELALFA